MLFLFSRKFTAVAKSSTASTSWSPIIASFRLQFDSDVECLFPFCYYFSFALYIFCMLVNHLFCVDGSAGSMHHHHHHSSLGVGGAVGGPGGPSSHRGGLLALHGGGSSPSNGCSSAAGLMSLAAELHRSTASSAAAAINSSASGMLGPLPPLNPSSVTTGPPGLQTMTGPAPGSTPAASAFPYPPAHLAAAAAAAAAAGHFAFLPLAAAAAHPGMMNLATMAAAAGHLHNIRAAAASGNVDHMMAAHGVGSGSVAGLHLDAPNARYGNGCKVAM
jgi:hypothetical protein